MATVTRTPIVSATPRRLRPRTTLNGPDMMQSHLGIDDDGAGPLLDFSEMVSVVNRFQRKFKAYTEHAIASINDDKADFDASRLQHSSHLQALDREIEEAKSAQRLLWETVAQEREADTQVRSRIQALTAQRASLSQRSAELQAEIAEAKAKLEARKKAKQAQRERFKAQVDQNGPELRLLQARTGCSIQPTKVGDQLRFIFQLVNPDDWADECYFVIDVSRPQYAGEQGRLLLLARRDPMPNTGDDSSLLTRSHFCPFRNGIHRSANSVVASPRAGAVNIRIHGARAQLDAQVLHVRQTDAPSAVRRGREAEKGGEGGGSPGRFVGSALQSPSLLSVRPFRSPLLPCQPGYPSILALAAPLPALIPPAPFPCSHP
ncbi:kinetochore-associated Ndc80 complex subunit spc25 [Thecaphora frezii]